MKRLLFLALVALLVVACLGLLASSALAYYWTPQPGEAYVPTVVPSEWWYVNTPGGEQQYQDSSVTPISRSSYTLYLYFGWGNVPLGTIQSLPNTLFVSVTLTRDDGSTAWSISGAASKAAWSPAYVAGTGPDWNKANVDYWAREWRVAVTQPDGTSLAVGHYTGTFTIWSNQSLVDFTGTSANGHSPAMDNKPKGPSSVTFSFSVAP